MSTIRPRRKYERTSQWADAEAIHAAISQSLGYDEKKVIDILANRTNEQRQLIAKIYEEVHSKDIIKDLKSNLGGSFENVVVACMTPIEEYYAKELNYAMSGFGFVTSDSILIEILCVLSNEMITAVKIAYGSIYKRPLEGDVDKATSDSFKFTLLSIIKCTRESTMEVHQGKVFHDAQALHDAGKEGDTTMIINILTSRNWVHLLAVFDKYHLLSSIPFEKMIKSNFSGSAREALLAIYQFTTDSDGFFADCLYNSMVGLGTRDRTLIRLVVTRSEIDMANIKVAFIHKYMKTLESFIEGDCSGDYKKMLLALITPFSIV